MSNKVLLGALSSVMLFANISAQASECNKSKTKVAAPESGRFYIGTEVGGNFPLSNEIKFKVEGEKRKFSLKRSAMYSGRVGYIYAPGMAVELSYTHQPAFKVGFKLPSLDVPQVPVASGAYVPGQLVPGTTKAVADIYTVNFTYDLASFESGFTPYFIGGAGIAKVDVKPTQLTLTIPSIAAAPDTEVFNIKRSKGKYFTWQAGLGAQKALTDNLSIDASAKLQVINNIKLRYTILDTATGQTKKDYVKKTLGGIELGIGFTYKL